MFLNKPYSLTNEIILIGQDLLYSSKSEHVSMAELGYAKDLSPLNRGSNPLTNYKTFIHISSTSTLYCSYSPRSGIFNFN